MLPISFYNKPARSLYSFENFLKHELFKPVFLDNATVVLKNNNVVKMTTERACL